MNNSKIVNLGILLVCLVVTLALLSVVPELSLSVICIEFVCTILSVVSLRVCKRTKSDADSKAISRVALIVCILTLLCSIGIKTFVYNGDTSSTITPTETTKVDILDLEHAKKDAQSFIDFVAFSRKSLIDQVVKNGFSRTIATEAVDSLGINWERQAVRAGKVFVDVYSPDSESLQSMLTDMGFTNSEVEFALASIYGGWAIEEGVNQDGN